MVVTTVPAKKKELQKSQLLGLVEFPEGFTPCSQASRITCTHTHPHTHTLMTSHILIIRPLNSTYC